MTRVTIPVMKIFAIIWYPPTFFAHLGLCPPSYVLQHLSEALPMRFLEQSKRTFDFYYYKTIELSKNYSASRVGKEGRHHLLARLVIFIMI